MEANIDYASPAARYPRRWWLPVALLAAAHSVWNWPRLTPTGFPNRVDQLALALLAAGAFIMARRTSLPGWAFSVFGAFGVTLFLLANFNDNNFRDDLPRHSWDLLLPRCLQVGGGAVLSRLLATYNRPTVK